MFDQKTRRILGDTNYLTNAQIEDILFLHGVTSIHDATKGSSFHFDHYGTKYITKEKVYLWLKQTN